MSLASIAIVALSGLLCVSLLAILGRVSSPRRSDRTLARSLGMTVAELRRLRKQIVRDATEWRTHP